MNSLNKIIEKNITKIEAKDINVICPYLAGTMQTLTMFGGSQLEQLAIVNKETRHLE